MARAARFATGPDSRVRCGVVATTERGPFTAAAGPILTVRPHA